MGRPKAFERDQAQILALRLFWRKGYAATSIEDLVQALGLSRSSLYGTFGDKHRLFLEALQLYSDRVLAGLARTLSEAPTPLAGIQAIFDEMAAGVGSDSGKLGCFMVNSVAELVPYDPAVTRLAAAYSAAFQGQLAAALARPEAGAIAGAIAGATAGQPTPEQQAAFVFNAIQGLRVLIKAGATREQVQAVCALTLARLA